MSQAAAVDYASYSVARAHLKSILDATASGRSVTIQRDQQVSVVMPADRLRSFLFRAVSPRVELAHENGKVVALMTGRSFVSEGANVADALSHLCVSLREYTEDWEARLQNAPNHRDNWALVQLIKLSSDAEILDWFERAQG